MTAHNCNVEQAYIGSVKVVDASVYPNLAKAEGSIVECIINVFDTGEKLYYVHPQRMADLGCDVGTDSIAFPFYPHEVEEISAASIVVRDTTEE